MEKINLEQKEEFSNQFYEIVLKSILTEKASRMIDFENKLCFEVKKKATKTILKPLFENEFQKKVLKVNIVNKISGKKNAIVSFKESGVASDIAAQFGLI